MTGIRAFMPSRLLLPAALLLAAASCHRFSPADFRSDPEGLYTASVRELRHGRWQRALDGLNVLSFELAARDTLLPKVRFYQAEARYGLGDFLTAAREFRRVADDFPADSLAAFALLRAGDAFARLWRDVELDPTHGQTAMATWQELAGRFPNSPAAPLAGVRLREMQDQFARKDYQTGLFYFRRGGYDSAILYFRGIIANYPSASIVPEVFVSLVQAYQAIGYREEREETCAHLRQYYPNRGDVRQICGDGNPGR